MLAGTMNLATPSRLSCTEGALVRVFEKVEIDTGVGSVFHDAISDGANFESLGCFGGNEVDFDLWDR